MKKILLSSMLVFSAVCVFSQNEIESKKGEPYLPEEGDWAIQINALPFVNYLGNLFSSAGTNNLQIQPLTNYPFSVAGKYFVADQTALRAKILLDFTRLTSNNLVVQDNQPAPLDPNVRVTDTRRRTSSSVFIGGGIEKRKGKTRLQGYYGGEALLLFSGGTVDSYNYGNQFGASNTAPTSTTDFDDLSSSPVSERLIESRTGTSFGAGARGFLGAEYFLLPKLSIGVEYGIGLMFITNGDGREVSQEWDPVQSTVVRSTSRIAGGNSFGLNTDISGGALTLTLHF